MLFTNIHKMERQNWVTKRPEKISRLTVGLDGSDGYRALTRINFVVVFLPKHIVEAHLETAVSLALKKQFNNRSLRHHNKLATVQNHLCISWI